MTFWLWAFLWTFALLVVPVSWLIGKAVGMERATIGRALAFAACEGLVAFAAMELMPTEVFLLKALAGVFAALLAAPLAFRGLMTSENARAVLGSVLLCVVGVVAVVLFLLV